MVYVVLTTTYVSQLNPLGTAKINSYTNSGQCVPKHSGAISKIRALSVLRDMGEVGPEPDEVSYARRRSLRPRESGSRCIFTSFPNESSRCSGVLSRAVSAYRRAQQGLILR